MQSINWEKHLYLWCKIKEYSMDSTFIKYRDMLRQILNKFPNLESTPLIEIQEYAASISNPFTRNNTLVVIRWAFDVVLKKPIDWRDLPYAKKPRKIQSIYTHEEAIKILQATKSPKQKAILALIIDTGCRINEVTAIDLKDCNSKERSIIVREAKGSKDRVIYPSEYVWGLIKTYYNTWHTKPTKFLFEGQIKGNPYTDSSIRQFVERSCKICGVEYKGIHAFRRLNGSWKVQNGVPETVVADSLGNSVKTLHKYYLIHSPIYLRNINSPLNQIHA